MDNNKLGAVKEAAREALQIVLDANKAELKRHEDRVAHLQETIFAVYDEPAHENNTPLLVALEQGENWFDFQGNTDAQRQFLFRRQLRHEYQAKQLEAKIERLEMELAAVDAL